MDKLTWQYNDKDVSEQTPPNKFYGFVYELILKDGSRYIGKKAMWNTTKKKLTQKEVAAMTNRREKKWKFITKESDWRRYTSSSKLFGSREVTQKVIVELALSKRHLTYLETKYMFQRNVLEDSRYLNLNISGRYYRDNLI